MIMVKRVVLLTGLLLVCFCLQGQVPVVEDRVLDTWTESWTETRSSTGQEVLYRESKHVVLYLDRDVLWIGDNRYELIRDLGPVRDLKGVLSLRFEALDKSIRRIRVVFLTGRFVNQIQVIYADRVYKYNLEQHW